MEIHQIECLLAVVETGSFRAAAEKLNKAQSAVSSAVKKLEDEFGFQIFDRAEYRPSLTARGQSLLPQFYNFRQQLSQINEHAHFLQTGHEPQVRLSVSALWPEEWLAPVLHNFTLQFPFTELIIQQEVLSADEALGSNEADLAIGEIFDEKGLLEKKPLKPIELLTVCSSRHPLAKLKGKISRSEFRKHRQVVLKSTAEDSSRVVGVETGQPQIGVYNFSLKKQLIMYGVGWGGMPSHLIQDEILHKKLITLNSSRRKVPISIAWSKKKVLGPCAKFLLSGLSISSKTISS